jgi:putative toxin-antitoxin system antitoxin component (TIGR02293 family)
MKKNKAYHPSKTKESDLVSDFQAETYGSSTVFTVNRGGVQSHYEINSGFGYFLKSLDNAKNLVEVGEKLDKNLSYAEILPIVDFLGLKASEVAKAASVSPSTVSRWMKDSLIGSPGSFQFFKIDEAIKKGVEIFGSTSNFKLWLNAPNLALGQVMPFSLILSATGLEMVHEALDALHFGNVL